MTAPTIQKSYLYEISQWDRISPNSYKYLTTFPIAIGNTKTGSICSNISEHVEILVMGANWLQPLKALASQQAVLNELGRLFWADQQYDIAAAASVYETAMLALKAAVDPYAVPSDNTDIGPVATADVDAAIQAVLDVYVNRA